MAGAFHTKLVSVVALVSLAACGTDGDAPVGTPPTSDEADLFCDPVDALADETANATPTEAPLTRFIDPRIGTGGSAFSVGTTYPGPQLPFGLAKPGPDTSTGGKSAEFSHCSGYAFGDTTIEAFSHARLHGAGIADYGGAALMPSTSMTPSSAGPRKHGSRFSHDTEVTEPGYYAVTLADTGVRVELTATAHVGVHRYTFSAGSPEQVVFIDAGHVLSEGNEIAGASVTVDPVAREVSGTSHIAGSYSRRFGGTELHFVARFDRPFSAHGTYVGGAATDGTLTAQGADASAFVKLDQASAQLNVHVGLSFVDVEHARANLEAELVPFDRARDEARAAWESRLGVLRIDARTDRDRKIAYTALYHTALMPTLASDVDGSYRGIDKQVHRAEGFRYFTDFSLWDTYRTLHPLVTLLYPNDARDFAASLTAMGKDGGFVPRWPLGTGETGGMVGDGGAVVLADTWARGVQGWDVESAYATLHRQATEPPPADRRGGREQISEYMTRGWVPKDAKDAGNSAGITLEYAHADHALGELAASLGKTDDANLFRARGQNWKNVFDPKTGFFGGRRIDGTFAESDPASMSDDFSEGTQWHYRFMVPHDVEGLAALMQRDRFITSAEQLFTRAACPGARTIPGLPNPYYWASNEPVLFSAWVFSALGDRERTARWTRWSTLVHYGDGPDGLPGNDDGGTMSAHYLFMALGLYPITGTDQWLLGSPLFPKTTLALASGTLTIDAPGASPKRRFPKMVTHNGAPAPNVLHHAQLQGATLHFELDVEPSAR